MTTSNFSARFRSLQWLTAVVLLVVSGRLAYSLAAGQLWLTLAALGVKTCSVLASLLFFGRSNRNTEPTIYPTLCVLLLMVASMSADFAVATLIR